MKYKFAELIDLMVALNNLGMTLIRT